MNSDRIETNNSYQFQPIDQDFPSNSTTSPSINSSHSIQRPIPISHHPPPRPMSTIECSKKHSAKRNSTIYIDTTIRSAGFPRSMTSDHLASHPPSNRLYYYPSVQDVLNALNQRSFEKESFV